MMWSVLLAVSLGMLLLEVIPSSQQQFFDDNELAPTFVPPSGGRKRDVSDAGLNCPDLAAESVDFEAGLVDLGGRSVDLTAGSDDLAARSNNLAASSVDFEAGLVDLAGRSVDITAGSVDLAARSIYLAASSVDLEAGLYGLWYANKFLNGNNRRLNCSSILQEMESAWLDDLCLVYTFQLNLLLKNRCTQKAMCDLNLGNHMYVRSSLMREMTVVVRCLKYQKFLLASTRVYHLLPALTRKAGSEMASPSSGGT
ncbi:hypothetical protein J6590_075712 [Homalodisca vitripennis]|nr:hypothetical protein J6590_075712 [Homalodisca vitripennis]